MKRVRCTTKTDFHMYATVDELIEALTKIKNELGGGGKYAVAFERLNVEGLPGQEKTSNLDLEYVAYDAGTGAVWIVLRPE